MDRWAGRVAVITGANGGIGSATCQFLADAGMKVVGCDICLDKIQEMAKINPNIYPYKCDLLDEEAITKMFDWIHAQPDLGKVDLCIPNAGLSTKSTLMEGTVKEWRHMMDVNVISLTLCAQLSIKSMLKNKVDDGQIIFISSLSGHRVDNCHVRFYASTKFAVRALTEGFRQEVRNMGKNNIRIGSISPSNIETGFSYAMYKDEPEKAQEIHRSPCLQAEDMVQQIKHILEQPRHVQIHDILIRATQQMT